MTDPDSVERRPPIEQTFRSTTWEWKRARITRRPTGQKAQPAKPSSLKKLSRRNMRDRLTITVKYRGGSEAWVEIEARGVTIRRPGHCYLIDIVRELNRDF